MNVRSFLGGLIGLGVIFQIALGEGRLVQGVFAEVHAGIGILGLIIVVAYLVRNTGNKPLLAVSSMLVILTLIQVALGMHLMHWLDLGLSHSTAEVSHRVNAYLLFIAGIAASFIAVRARRKTQ